MNQDRSQQPLILGSPTENFRASPNVSPVNVGAEHLLVIEDEDIVRRVVVRRLRQHGYNVREARNGLEALEVCRQHCPFDLIISDLVMPEMNGRDVMAALRKICPNARSLFMSGYSEDLMAHRGVIEPGLDFLEKSQVTSDLLPKVREILDRPRP